MKKLIGIFIILLVICFIGIIGLRIWGISIVSLDTIIKSSLTLLLLLGILIIALAIIYGGFLKNNSKGYNAQVGNRAHPKL